MMRLPIYSVTSQFNDSSNGARSKIVALFAATCVNRGESRCNPRERAWTIDSSSGRVIFVEKCWRVTLVSRGELEGGGGLFVASVVYRSFCHRLAVNRRFNTRKSVAPLPPANNNLISLLFTFDTA